MARYKFVITNTAQRDLKRIAALQRQRIGQNLQYFTSTDDPLKFAVQLTGVKPPVYRFRVGKYRVFFDVKKDTLWILSVSLRDKASL